MGLMPHPERAVEAASAQPTALVDISFADSITHAAVDGFGISAQLFVLLQIGFERAGVLRRRCFVAPALAGIFRSLFVSQRTAGGTPALPESLTDWKMLDTEIKVTPELAAEHGLTAEEYARIQKILGREPNFTELGIFSVMWSEHCPTNRARCICAACRLAVLRCCRDRAKTRVSSISATVWPRHSNGIAQSSELRRAVPGCGDRRGRDSARYLHDGCAPDCRARFAAVRADQCERFRG